MYRLSKIGLIIFMLVGGFALPLFGGQIEVLEDLYSQTDGDKWNHNDNWLNGEDPCSTKYPWYGITCEGSEVIKIELGVNNLVGTIPDSLGSLQSLQVLRFNNNGLTGKIPDDLGNLYATLISLDVNNNSLDGSINFVTKLENLLKLNMYNNNFSGLIPSNIGNLNKLTELDLGKNQFTGTIPTSIGGLTSAIGIWLNNNELTGVIPHTLTGLATNLGSLNLSDNQLSGVIPSGFKDTNLDYLELARNCDLYSDDQDLINYINALPTSTYQEILNSNKCPSSQKSVNMAPIIAYLLSDSTPPPLAPSEPFGIQAAPVNRTSDQINVTWQDGSNNESGFRIYRSNTVDGTKIHIDSVGANVTSYRDTGLSGCREYYYWVTAYNNGGESGYSDYANATTAPAAPTGFKATGMEVRSIYFYWNSTACAVKYHFYSMGDIAEGYGPYNRKPEQETITGTSATLTNEITDKYIFYRISAEDADGNEGSLSCQTTNDAMQGGATSVSDTCRAAIAWAHSDKILGGAGTINTYTDKIVIQWNPVPTYYDEDNNPTQWMPQYKLYNKDPYGNWAYGETINAPNPTTSAPITRQWTGLSANTRFEFKIVAYYEYYGVNTEGEPVYITAQTAPSSGTTDPYLGTPWLMTTSYYPGMIPVGWGSIHNATFYQLQHSIKSNGSYGSWVTAYEGSSLKFNDPVGNWKECHFRVRACNSSGCGDWSNEEYGNSTGL